MNRTVIKNILREVIKNPGRFLAVLGIIMLGSGFFVGLRITREAMLKTASEFLNEGSFYDYKLISTVGFSKDADEELETTRIHPDSGTGQKGSGNPTGVSTDQNSVLLVEGGMEQDAFVYLPGRDDSVMHFMSLPEKINRPRVVQGRLPENPGEILLDVNASGSYHIGDEAELSEENDDKTLEAFSTHTFVVTGFAVSPLYLNYERGSSSLGTGSVNSFAYILPEDFTADYDTAVYVKLPGTEDIDLYDDKYDELAGPYEAPVKEQAEKLADKRFASLLQENREKLEENEETYQDGLKEYKEQEKKARKELKDAKKKLEDGKKLLDDNEEAYQKGLLEFDQKKKEAEAAMKEAEDKLLQSSKELSDGEKAYGEGLAAYKEGEAAYAAGIQEFTSRSEQAATLLSFYTLYTDFRNAFSDTGSVLSKMLLDIAAANTPEKDRKPSDSTSDKDKDKDQGKDSGQKTGPGDSGKKTGPDDSGKKTDDEDPGQKTGPDDQETAEERRERIAEIYRQNRDALQENLTALTKAAEALADEAEKTYGETEELKTFRTQLENLKKTAASLSEDEADLSASLAELFAASTALYNAASGLFNEAGTQMESAEKELEAGRKKLEESRAQLDAARAELERNRGVLDEGWAAYFAGTEELNRQREEAEEAFSETEKELEEAEEALEEGREEYEEGLLEYQEGKKEAETALREAKDKLKDARQQLDHGWKALEEAEAPEVFALGRSANIGYVCLENDSMIVRNIARVFPAFFLLVAALICMTTIARMTDEQRGQIGVMMALGYKKSIVGAKYTFFSVFAALLGCGIGIPLLGRIFPVLIWQAYRIMYSFSEKLAYYMDWQLFAIVTAGYMLAMYLVTRFSLHAILKQMPAQVLRGREVKSGKRVILERIPALWNRLSFMWKVTLRNVFRYKTRVLMMIVGVSGCTALLLTGFGIRDSISDIVGFQYSEITHYEYEVMFRDAPDEKAREDFQKTALRYAGDSTFVLSESVKIRGKKNEGSATLISYDPDVNFTDFMTFNLKGKAADFTKNSEKEPGGQKNPKGQNNAGSAAGPGHSAGVNGQGNPSGTNGQGSELPRLNEAFLSNALADKLGIKAGDEAVLLLNDREYPVKIGAVFTNYIYNYLVMSDETYEAITGEVPEKKTAYVMKREDAQDASARFLNVDGVLNVTAGSVLRERIGGIMDNLIYIVLLTIASAAGLAFIVIYNLININITERMREIATVKVLGFYPAEAAVYVLRENVLLTILGALAGLPLGVLLNRFVMGTINVDLVSFSPRILFPSFLYAVGLTIVFSILVYLAMFRKLDKIDAAAALKAAE